MLRGGDDQDDMEELGCLRHQNQMNTLQQWWLCDEHIAAVVHVNTLQQWCMCVCVCVCALENALLSLLL